MRCVISAVALVAIICLAGCMNDQMAPGQKRAPKSSAADNRSLYDRIGGEKGIARINDDFIARLSKDKRIDLERKNSAHPWDPTPANVMILKVRANALMSKVTGGPDYYQAVGGRDMKTAHRGMGITEAEWNAGVDVFTQSLNACRVGEREKKELLDAVAGLKDQMVEKK